MPNPADIISMIVAFAGHEERALMNNTHLSGWARAVLALPNLVFVVLDTTGIDRDADILRVLVVTLYGDELYHQIVKPVRHQNQPNTAYTGITQSELDQAETLAEHWPRVQDALAGKFVLAYGLDFVQDRLRENALAYHLAPIYVVGDCLHETASQYCHRTSIKLPAACAHVGQPMLIGPGAQARAYAQMRLLQAIADGQPRRAIAVAPPVVALEDDDDDDDGHPF